MLVLALFATAPNKHTAELLAAEVICTEAGYGASDVQRIRGRLVAHVINHRAKAARRFGDKHSWPELLITVLTARNQWAHNCAAPSSQYPKWMRPLTRALVSQQMHFSAPPPWMTEDVQWVVSEREGNRIGPHWGKTRCLVKTIWGLSFYGKCD